MRIVSYPGRIILLASASAISTLFGMGALLEFNQTAGSAGGEVAHWPAGSVLPHAGDHASLLVFMHPFCPCSVATLAELSGLIDRTDKIKLPSTTVLFYRPSHADWQPGDLWKKAQALPGATVIWDENGREANRFGALTSGYTLLYSAGGELLFRGGVTGSRGHQGANYGLERLAASLDSGRGSASRSLVFGCALGGPARTGDRR